MAHGRAYCEGVNVQWALGDATAAEGGCFVCIPGEENHFVPTFLVAEENTNDHMT